MLFQPCWSNSTDYNHILSFPRTFVCINLIVCSCFEFRLMITFCLCGVLIVTLHVNACDSNVLPLYSSTPRILISVMLHVLLIPSQIFVCKFLIKRCCTYVPFTMGQKYSWIQKPLSTRWKLALLMDKWILHSERWHYGMNWQKYPSHNSENTIVIKQWHTKGIGCPGWKLTCWSFEKSWDLYRWLNTQTHTQSWLSLSSKYTPAGYPWVCLLSSPWQQAKEPGDTPIRQ